MIAKTHILNNLDTLERLYDESTSAKKGLLYSKLAILELCGWIEESMDDIVRRCANRNLRNPANRVYVEQLIIRKTYSFTYDNHFRPMLARVLGIRALERIERRLDPARVDPMKASLDVLKQCRDSEAHTHVRGVTKSLDAPSVTKKHFSTVYEGLIDIDAALRQLGF